MVFNIYSQDFLLFNFSQCHIATLIDYFLKRFFAVDLNQNVRVQKTEGQVFRQNYSGSALAGARHAYKGHVGFHPITLSILFISFWKKTMRQGMALLFLFFDWRQRIVSYPVESFPVLKFYFEHLEFKRPFHS